MLRLCEPGPVPSSTLLVYYSALLLYYTTLRRPLLLLLPLLYSTLLYSALLYSLYSTVLYSTLLYSTAPLLSRTRIPTWTGPSWPSWQSCQRGAQCCSQSNELVEPNAGCRSKFDPSRSLGCGSGRAVGVISLRVCNCNTRVESRCSC